MVTLKAEGPVEDSIGAAARQTHIFYNSRNVGTGWSDWTRFGDMGNM